MCGARGKTTHYFSSLLFPLLPTPPPLPPRPPILPLDSGQVRPALRHLRGQGRLCLRRRQEDRPPHHRRRRRRQQRPRGRRPAQGRVRAGLQRVARRGPDPGRGAEPAHLHCRHGGIGDVQHEVRDERVADHRHDGRRQRRDRRGKNDRELGVFFFFSFFTSSSFVEISAPKHKPSPILTRIALLSLSLSPSLSPLVFLSNNDDDGKKKKNRKRGPRTSSSSASTLTPSRGSARSARTSPTTTRPSSRPSRPSPPASSATGSTSRSSSTTSPT